MHYGGSTLDNRSERFLRSARLLNEVERIRDRRGGLTPYQQAIRFWAYSKLRRHQKGAMS